MITEVQKGDLTNPANLPAHLKSTALAKIDLDEVNIPRARSAGVGSSSLKVRHGDKDPAEISGKMDVVILLKNRRRTYFEGDYDPNEIVPPDCQSHNMVTPDAGVNARQAEACEHCAKSQWGEADGGKTVPPACGERLDLLLLREGKYLPMILDLPATTLRSFRAFNTQAVEECGVNWHNAIWSLELIGQEGKGPRFTGKFKRWLSEVELSQVEDLRDRGMEFLIPSRPTNAPAGEPESTPEEEPAPAAKKETVPAGDDGDEDEKPPWETE